MICGCRHVAADQHLRYPARRVRVKTAGRAFEFTRIAERAEQHIDDRLNSKSDLAKALIQRFADDGIELFDEMMERSRKLSDDPLQQFLIMIGLNVEMFENLTEPYPGCLLASYVYELQQFDADVRPIINSEMLHWRKALTTLIDRIKLRYPPDVDVDSAALADMFLSTFEGAFVMSKALQEPKLTAQQLKLYRTFIETLFQKE